MVRLVECLHLSIHPKPSSQVELETLAFDRPFAKPRKIAGVTIKTCRSEETWAVLHVHQGNSPNTATPFGVPTKTLPFTIIGVMNLLPGPN